MRWCPACREERDPWAERCGGCGAVLVDERPPDVAPGPEIASIHLGALEPERRVVLLRLLRDAGVPHEVVAEEVRFAAERRGVAQRLLLLAASDRPVDTVPPDVLAELGGGRPGDGLRPASTARRMAGAVGNVSAYLLLLAVVLGVVVLADQIGGSGGDVTGGPVVSFMGNTSPALLSIVFTALAGGTPGLLLFGMRVVDLHGRRPGWIRSAARALVVWGPYLALSYGASALDADGSPLGALLTVAALGWFVVLTWSVHRGPQHRGWQDRAAGVSVVDVGARSLRAGSGRGR